MRSAPDMKDGTIFPYAVSTDSKVTQENVRGFEQKGTGWRIPPFLYISPTTGSRTWETSSVFFDGKAPDQPEMGKF